MTDAELDAIRQRNEARKRLRQAALTGHIPSDHEAAVFLAKDGNWERSAEADIDALLAEIADLRERLDDQRIHALERAERRSMRED